MSDADAQTHGDHSQWAETSHCRVAGVRHFGAFAAARAHRPARRAAGGPRAVRHGHRARGRLSAPPAHLAVRRARRPHQPADRGARRRQRAAHAARRRRRRRRGRPARQRVPHGGRHQRAPRRRRHRLRAAAAPGGRTGGGGRSRHRRLRLPRLPRRPRRRRFQHRASLGGHGGRQRGEGRHGPAPARCARCGPRHHRLRLRPHAHDRRRAAMDVRRGPARLRLPRGAHGLRHRLVPRLRGRHGARQAARLQRGARVPPGRGDAVAR